MHRGRPRRTAAPHGWHEPDSPVLGVVGFPVAAMLSTAVSVLTWIVLKNQVDELKVFTIGTDQNALLVFGLLALALAVFAALYHPLLRRARAENLALGALAWWLALTVAFTLAAPSAAYLFALPTIAALGVTLWRLAGQRRAGWQTAAGVAVPLAVLVVVYAPVMLVFTLLGLRLDGLGLPVVGLMGLFAVLAAGLLTPHLAPRIPLDRGRTTTSWLLPATAALTAIALLGAGVARLGYDADNPRPDFVSYVLDADTRKASWETGDRDSWTAPMLESAQKADIELAPFSTVAGWRAPAPTVDLDPPGIQQTGRRTLAGATTLRLRLSSPRGADALAVEIRTPGAITAAAVEGQGLPMTASLRRGELELPYVGVPVDGIELELTVCGGGTLRATVRDYTQGLPTRAGAPARPAETMPAAISFRADPTVVAHTVRLAL